LRRALSQSHFAQLIDQFNGREVGDLAQVRMAALTVAPGEGAIMAARKGPAMWLRYGHIGPVLDPVSALFS